MNPSNDPGLAFEVEAIPHKKTKETTDPNTPVNVKVKLKNPKQDGANKALVIQSSKKQETMDVVKLNDSNQTIMSFEVYVEDEHKLKQTKSVLGKATPETHFNTTTLNSTKPSSVWFLGGKCKPGGCLDPRPVDEDKYAYEVSKATESVAATEPKDQKTKSQTSSAEKIKRTASSSFSSFLQRNKNRSKNSVHDLDDGKENIDGSISNSKIVQPQKETQKSDEIQDGRKPYEHREYRHSSDPLYKPKKSSDTEPQKQNENKTNFPTVVPVPLPIPLPIGGLLASHDKQQTKDDSQKEKQKEIKIGTGSISSEYESQVTDKLQDSNKLKYSTGLDSHSKTSSRFDAASILSDKKQAKIAKKDSRSYDSTKFSKTSKDGSPTTCSVSPDRKKTLLEEKSKTTNKYSTVIPDPVPIPIPLNFNKIKSEHSTKTQKDSSLSETLSKTSKELSGKEIILKSSSPEESISQVKKKSSRGNDSARLSQTSKDNSPSRYKIDKSRSKTSKEHSPTRITKEKISKETSPSRASSANLNKTPKDASPTRYNVSPNRKSSYIVNSSSHVSDKIPSEHQHLIPIPISIPIPVTIDRSKHDSISKVYQVPERFSPSRNSQRSRASKEVSPTRYRVGSKEASPTKCSGSPGRRSSIATSQSVQDKSNIPSQYPFIIPTPVSNNERNYTNDNSPSYISKVSKTSKDTISEMNKKNRLKSESMSDSIQNDYLIQGLAKSDTTIQSSKLSYHQSVNGNGLHLHEPIPISSQKSSMHDDKSLSSYGKNLGGSKSATNKSSKINLSTENKICSRSPVDSIMYSSDSGNNVKSAKIFSYEFSIRDKDTLYSSPELASRNKSNSSRTNISANLPRSRPDSPTYKTDSGSRRDSEYYSPSQHLSTTDQYKNISTGRMSPEERLKTDSATKRDSKYNSHGPDLSQSEQSKSISLVRLSTEEKRTTDSANRRDSEFSSPGLNISTSEQYKNISLGKTGTDEDSKRSISFKVAGPVPNELDKSDLLRDDQYKDTDTTPFAYGNEDPGLGLKRTDGKFYINLGFESKTTEDNELCVNTFDPTRKNPADPSENQSKNVIVMQTMVQNLGSVIKFPIDANNELNISFSKINGDSLQQSDAKLNKIKSGDKITSQIDVNAKLERNNKALSQPDSKTRFQDDKVSAKVDEVKNEYVAEQVSFEDQKSLKSKKRTKNELLAEYINEMYSLQGVIKDVKIEIDKLALQQSLLREKITKSSLNKSHKLHSHTALKTKQGGKCCAASTCTYTINKNS